MNITLRLFGGLNEYLPAGARSRNARLNVPEGTTPLQLILQLGIPYGGDEGQMVVAVNDVEVEHTITLRDGDVVSMFEPLAGG